MIVQITQGVAGADGMLIEITQVAAPPALSFAGALTATGTNQATAFPLSAAVNVVAVCPPGAGVALPAVNRVKVLNRSTETLLVYPPVGQAIETQPVNGAVEIGVNGAAWFDFDGGTTWWVS